MTPRRTRTERRDPTGRLHTETLRRLRGQARPQVCSEPASHNPFTCAHSGPGRVGPGVVM